jgi:hypothetical protein
MSRWSFINREMWTQIDSDGCEDYCLHVCLLGRYIPATFRLQKYVGRHPVLSLHSRTPNRFVRNVHQSGSRKSQQTRQNSDS